MHWKIKSGLGTARDRIWANVDHNFRWGLDCKENIQFYDPLLCLFMQKTLSGFYVSVFITCTRPGGWWDRLADGWHPKRPRPSVGERSLANGESASPLKWKKWKVLVWLTTHRVFPSDLRAVPIWKNIVPIVYAAAKQWPKRGTIHKRWGFKDRLSLRKVWCQLWTPLNNLEGVLFWWERFI